MLHWTKCLSNQTAQTSRHLHSLWLILIALLQSFLPVLKFYSLLNGQSWWNGADLSQFHMMAGVWWMVECSWVWSLPFGGIISWCLCDPLVYPSSIIIPSLHSYQQSSKTIITLFQMSAKTKSWCQVFIKHVQGCSLFT